MNVSQDYTESKSAYRPSRLARSYGLSREFKARAIFIVCACTVAPSLLLPGKQELSFLFSLPDVSALLFWPH
jgi:hypothetical protein